MKFILLFLITIAVLSFAAMFIMGAAQKTSYRAQLRAGVRPFTWLQRMAMPFVLAMDTLWGGDRIVLANAKQGHRETRRQLTARIYFKQTGTAAFRFLGHTLQCDLKIKESRTDIPEPGKGVIIEVGSILNQIGWLYEAKLNEQFKDTLKLIHLATQSADMVQAAIVAPAGTASFEAVEQGATYFIGKLNVSDVVVTVAAAAKVLNVDYKLDAGSGAITIIEGGSIADDADVDVTFGCAAVTTEVYNALLELRKTGDFRILYFDQYSEVPVDTHTFNGECWISDRGQNTGKVITECTLNILASEKPAIVTRA